MKARSRWGRPSILVAAVASLLVGVGPGFAQSALDIMKKQRAVLRVRDEEETQQMTLVNKNGETKQRKIVRYTAMGADDLSKTLVRFLAPRDVENTALLTWEAKDGDDNQWLYLPATRKAKRIASSGKKNRFMGTGLAFEDLRPEPLGLHHYTLLGSESVDGHDCWVIEATPATERQASESGYRRRKLWIRQDNYWAVKREYYDKRDKLEKVQTERKLKQIKGTVWRADEFELHDMQSGTRTIVIIERRLHDQGLKDGFFTEIELTRGGS